MTYEAVTNKKILSIAFMKASYCAMLLVILYMNLCLAMHT